MIWFSPFGSFLQTLHVSVLLAPLMDLLLMIGRTDRFAVHRSGRHLWFVMDSLGGFVQISLCTMCKICRNLSSLWVFCNCTVVQEFFQWLVAFEKSEKRQNAAYEWNLPHDLLMNVVHSSAGLVRKKHFSHHGFSGSSGSQTNTIWSFLCKRVIFHWTIIMVDWVGVLYKWSFWTLAKRCSGTTAYMSHVTCDNEAMQFDSEIQSICSSKFYLKIPPIYKALNMRYPYRCIFSKSLRNSTSHGHTIAVAFSNPKMVGLLGGFLVSHADLEEADAWPILSSWAFCLQELKQVAAPIYHKMVHNFLFMDVLLNR